MPEPFALDIYRGDSEHWTFTLFKDAGKTQPYDLAGATAKAEVRAAPGDPVLVTLGCEVVPPNVVEVDLPVADSEDLAFTTAQWDLQITWVGPPQVRKTVLRGAVNVSPDITDSSATVLMVAAAQAPPTSSAWEQRSTAT